MNVTDIIPREFHPALRWLGRLKTEWLLVEPDDRAEKPNASIIQPDLSAVRTAPGFAEHADALARLFGLAKTIDRREPGKGHRVAAYAMYRACAALLANGPKTFLPTAEQFVSMGHVDVHVPIAEYYQPYPAMTVQIPKDARTQLADEFGLPAGGLPQFLLTYLHHMTDGRNCLMIWLIDPPDRKEFPGDDGLSDLVGHYQMIGDRPHFADLEQVLRLKHMSATDADRPQVRAAFDYSERCFRACVNLMLLLTHYGSRLGPPLNPRDWERHRRRPDLAERFALADFRTVELTQQVVVRQEVRDPHHGPALPAGQPGTPKAPHWRRGHWRRLPPGPEGEARRTIVRPCLVRPDRLTGDLGDSSTTYVG